MNIVREIKKPLMITLVFIIICGLLYPLFLTAIGQLAFNHKANGSMVMIDGKPVGSKIVGQDFTGPEYLKGRPSAVNYNTYTLEDKETGRYGGISSGSNNFSATNPELKARVEKDIALILEANPTATKGDIPADLVTQSGSGLDPSISPASAQLQVSSISKASGIPESRIREIIKENSTGKALGVFGEPTVNVLKVNVEIYKEMSNQ